ncbi:DNA gyrase inhibitor [Pseudomonas brassicacearum]|uniref:DNA gyrase inhibitor n=1 Tax=Pseudomonas brassicacearum TaxID=930166 RepID=A0A423HE48_9PSED|nr:GyrI-like domain-containing protein [Pseudomonas brassicacearum]RON11493.1 DNA gyrase inhibitor [Pseudomonas brassicacearum]
MNVTLIELPPARVAYLRYTGPYGPGIGTFWRETVAPWMIENDLLNKVRYGIGHDDPSVTPAAYCRYDACVEVPEGFNAAFPFAVTTLPGGLYAVARFKGPALQIAAAWGELCAQWMPASGLDYDKRPNFERYPVDASYDQKTDVMEVDMCIAVKKR